MSVTNIIAWFAFLSVMVPGAIYSLVYPYYGMHSFTESQLGIAMHYIVLLTATYVAVFRVTGRYLFGKILLIWTVGYVLHHLIFWAEAGKVIWESGMLNLMLPYLMLVFFGGIFGSTFLGKMRKARIHRTGIKATAYVIAFEDTQQRLKEGAHLQYRMELTLRIEDHPHSPYEITNYFWVSEFYIHIISSGKPLEVMVDRDDHEKVALGLY